MYWAVREDTDFKFNKHSKGGYLRLGQIEKEGRA